MMIYVAYRTRAAVHCSYAINNMYTLLIMLQMPLNVYDVMYHSYDASDWAAVRVRTATAVAAVAVAGATSLPKYATALGS
jgi:hypothetical protein